MRSKSQILNLPTYRCYKIRMSNSVALNHIAKNTNNKNETRIVQRERERVYITEEYK